MVKERSIVNRLCLDTKSRGFWNYEMIVLNCNELVWELGSLSQKVVPDNKDSNQILFYKCKVRHPFRDSIPSTQDTSTIT
jgi:hypothetical protein